MSAERHQRLKELFAAALPRSPADREAFLDSACAGDAELRRELVALLAHADRPGVDLERGGLDLRADWSEQVDEDLTQRPGVERIGSYRIREVLGRGGMGVVYLAEQENPRRTVALKVIRSDASFHGQLGRFERETRALARLQHPGIAQIFEAGTADNGAGPQPYYAMELVRGTSLIRYAREHALDLRQRLELMIQVCEAVQHAHERGVIHRDLKPGNVIVDQGGHAKILDFGIARLVGGETGAASLRTQTGQLVGTLPYMSPEQVTGRPDEVDARTDVYALGVLCYELLSGRRPHDTAESTLPETVRAISEEEPTPLSSIDRVFRGDLDTIVMKALEKEPDRRYRTAADLARDIRRYLDDEPIVARPVSTLYQLRKFTRRNKAMVGGVVAVFLMLVVAVVGTSLGMVQARRDRDEARHQQQVARDIVDFLDRDLLQQADPYHEAGPRVTLLSVLDRASESIGDRFEYAPEVHAAIRSTLGRTYANLRQLDQAERHLRIAADLLADLYGPRAERTIEARWQLARTLIDLQRLDEAEAEVDRAHADAVAALGEDHVLTAQLVGARAVLLKRRGRFAESEASYRRSIAMLERAGATDDRIAWVTRSNLALVLADQRKFEEAERIMREVVAAYTRINGERHPDPAFGMMNLGHVLWLQGRRDEAEALWRRAYEIRVEVLGEDNPDTINALYALGLIASDRGDLDEALRIQKRVLEARRRIFEPGHADRLSAQNSIGVIYERQGRYEEAETAYRAAYEGARDALGPVHYLTDRYRTNLLGALRQQGKTDALRAVHAEYFAFMEHALPGTTDPEILNRYAWALLTCEAEDLRDPARALAAATRAVDLTSRADPSILDTYALALSQNDRLDDAIRAQREAIALVDEDDAGRRAALTRQLDEFLARRPGN